jgi:formate hydrogenlyase transcriptional activator
MVGCSVAIRRLREQIHVVAPTDATVLIHGETGTGKELVARALHELSGRRGGRFIKVNCAAIPSGLLESEMFGHERGAFTGALSHRAGRFEQAHRGTLFLDEVGDLPLELQPKLLRVVQEQEFERLGGMRTICTDVRLVAASHRTLERMVDERSLRADLYYRLSVFPIVVPPLRERRDDIPLLVRAFVARYAQRLGRRIDAIPPGTLNALTAHDWPGNVRELQNCIERAVILSPGNVLCVPLESLGRGRARSQPAATTLEETDRQHIAEALRQTNWVIGGPLGAAARLGLPRTTLLSKMKKLGISRATDARARTDGALGDRAAVGIPS